MKVEFGDFFDHVVSDGWSVFWVGSVLVFFEKIRARGRDAKNIVQSKNIVHGLKNVIPPVGTISRSHFWPKKKKYRRRYCLGNGQASFCVFFIVPTAVMYRRVIQTSVSYPAVGDVFRKYAPPVWSIFGPKYVSL